jgi:hypothetical protein
MPDIISYATEVYYSFRDDDTHTKKMVPIRGMYVTGEYTPPEYIDPALCILEFKTNNVTIENYVEKSVDYEMGSSHHLFDIDVDDSFDIVAYSKATAPDQTDGTTHHLFDIDVDDSFDIVAYSKATAPDQTDGTTHHLFDLSVAPTFIIDSKSNEECSSQPEPILRLIEFNVSTPTIEDVSLRKDDVNE